MMPNDSSMTAPHPNLLRVIVALGTTQIIGYGTLYYAFAILSPILAEGFETTTAPLFAIFSVGLLLGGFASPWLGHLMDRHGAPRLMALGSLSCALLLAALSAAPNLILFAVIFCLLEIASVMVLYSAAFATLARMDSVRARRSITHLTLIAGFASTLFWPLTGWLAPEFGWRMTYLIFAALHLFIALPLHLWLTRLPNAPAGALEMQAPQFRPVAPQDRRIAFWCIAISFALSGALMSGLNVHLVPVLKTMDLGGSAYLVSMLMGPAQVAVRLTDALFWRALHPTSVALISASALCLSVLLLVIGLPELLAGAAFALVFGAGQGLSTIVSGTLPLTLFGAEGFGARLGKLAAIRTFLSAFAPFLLAASLQATGTIVTLTTVLGMGVCALVPLIYLHFRLRSAPATER